LSRDPKNEGEGINLCAFVANEPTGWFDTDGRSPDLPSGTVHKFSLQAGGKGSAVVARRFYYLVRPLAEQAMCFVKKFIPNVQTYPPVWFDTYWATLTISQLRTAGTSDVNAFTEDRKWIFISTGLWPQSHTRFKFLDEVRHLGTTLLHELDHYYTGSDDDGSRRDPTFKIDHASHVPFIEAAKKKLGPCHLCDKHPSYWPVLTLAEQYACDCGIDLSTYEY
jgi:hypothetical protein